MNNLNIIGRLTGEYEVKYSKDGKPIGKFTLAVDTGYGDNKHASFFDVVTFGKRADKHGECIGKGSKIGVTGSIKQERWESQDGTKRSKVVITAMQIEYLDGKPSAGNSSPKKQSGFDSVSDEDIPFN